MSVASLAACSADPPTPDAAAAALGQALGSGDFGAVPLADGSPAPDALAQARTVAFEKLGDVQPQVTGTGVTVDEQDPKRAIATYHWAWNLGATWEYDVTAQLDLVDGDDGPAWRATWRTSLLAPDLIDGETLAVARTPARRGTILAGDGSAIVQPRPVWRIGIDKTRVAPEGQDAATRALATALGMDPEAYARRVAAAGERAFVEAIVVRQDDAAYDVAALRAIEGVNAVADELPLAPNRLFARPILGQAGPATAEIIDASGGAVVAGDTTGLSGLQKQYDAQLRGTPGLSVEARNGPATRVLFAVDPVPGAPLSTTLDGRLEQAAEDVLAPVPGAAGLVAIRPSTGEVLAAASGPNGDGLSTSTVGQYAPGSTFKVAGALALLRAGLTPDTVVTCPTSVTVDGRQFDNFPGYPASANGDVPLRTAFANSCNTAFIGQRDAAPQAALVAAAGSLGLAPDPSLGFPAFLGTVPTDSDGTDHAASMIGQGRVLASPLGMATVAASVAAGHTVVPVLVRPADGSTPQASSGAPELTGAEAETLRGLMRSVVTEGGATFLGDVPAPEVYAKTGTAQYQAAGGSLANHAWMIAIHGDLAVCVFVETGDLGSTTAGPLMEQFLRAAG